MNRSTECPKEAPGRPKLPSPPRGAGRAQPGPGGTLKAESTRASAPVRMTVLSAGPAQPHAGWVAIDELAWLMADYFGAPLLSPRPAAGSIVDRLRGRQRFEPLDCDGGDVLIVIARSPADLALIDAIPQARRRFGRIFGWVTDSYFQAGFGRATTSYDAITVTAHEDVAFPRDRFGVVVHQMYQGTDCLAWAPRHHAPRSVDLIGFGRIPPSFHECFAAHFHSPDTEGLYLHSPLGHLAGPEVRRERAMLFKLLHRAKVSLAFHLYVEPQGDRPRSMMVTSRWLESLVAGCLVAGKRPVSRMADEMLCWPESTIELDDDPGVALEQLRVLLADDDAIAGRRAENVRRMCLLHDWRHRIRDLCGLFGLPQPAGLDEDLDRLGELAARQGVGPGQ